MAKQTVTVRVNRFLKENPGEQFAAREIADLLGIDRDRKLLLPQDDNPLVNAPHTCPDLLDADWPHPYPRAQAAYPANWVRTEKYCPPSPAWIPPTATATWPAPGKNNGKRV